MTPQNLAEDAPTWLRHRYGRDVLFPLGPQPRPRDLPQMAAKWLGREYGRGMLAPLGGPGGSALAASVYAIEAWGRSDRLNRAHLVVALRALQEVLEVYRSGRVLRLVAPFVIPDGAQLLAHQLDTGEPAELPAPLPGAGYSALYASAYAIQVWGRGDRANRERAARALRALTLVLQTFGCANRVRAVIPCVLDWSHRGELWPVIAPADDDGRTLAPLPEHVNTEGPR